MKALKIANMYCIIGVVSVVIIYMEKLDYSTTVLDKN